MKKVYLETFGCQMNVSDSERVATHLASDGFEITTDENSADVVLFNTCSVREKAEHKLYTRVGQVRNSARVKGKKPIVGVLGCVAQLEGETLFDKTPGVDFVLGTQAVGRVSGVVEAALGGRRKIADLAAREEDYRWTTDAAYRHSAAVAFVPVIEGCNKFCTYCIVPFSRGRERSLPASEIVRQIALVRAQGAREIHLIGQNVNSYRPKTDWGMENFKGATAFSRLLRAVAATGVERVKFTTSFPRDFHADIVEAINEHDNLCNWVHLPVQTGSDRVLKAMRRGHTIESYRRKIDNIKNSARRIALSTDIIVGFPGETEEDFRQTLELAEYCRFDAAYVFKYSPRPGTPAAEMPDTVSPQEKTERFLRLETILKKSQAESLQKTVGETFDVLIEKKSAKSEAVYSGHTTCHKVVNCAAAVAVGGAVLGEIVKVRITENKSNTLFGRII